MYSSESIEQPLKQVLNQLNEVSANSSLSVQHLINKLAGLQVQHNRFVIKETSEIRFIDIDDVEWIKGAGSYVELYLFNSKKPVLYRCSLKELVERLDSNLFVRIHRSTIIRRNQIQQMVHIDRGDYEVNLKSGQKVIMSRSYRENFPEVFA